MPFPSTRVVHPRWSAHHQPVTEGAMNATVRVTHGSTGGGWTSGGGASGDEQAIVTYPAGPARITYSPTQARDADAADQDVTIRRVTVALPRDAEPQDSGALLEVLGVDDNGMAWLVGHTFVVGSVGRSSYSWEQLLECSDDLSNQDEEEEAP